MNPHVKMILYGIAAGSFSALVWAGFSYATGSELGWIAWGVGLLVGLGVRLAGDDVRGWTPGILAVAIAILSILCGKYLTVRFIIAREFKDVEKVLESIDPEFAQVELAKEVVAEYEKQKKKLDWPEKKRLLTTATKGPQMGSEFPADVWKETNRRWNKLTSDEKEQWTSTAEKILRTRIEMARSSALDRGFDASFGPFDILWFLLAAATAFRIGSRVVVADD